MVGIFQHHLWRITFMITTAAKLPRYRITSEIIEDLPGVYEMPAEAVAWVERVRYRIIFSFIFVSCTHKSQYPTTCLWLTSLIHNTQPTPVQMIEYNVAGGKMNRGLTVLDVQQTFAKAQGKPLSNKVRIRFFLIGLTDKNERLLIHLHNDFFALILINCWHLRRDVSLQLWVGA